MTSKEAILSALLAATGYLSGLVWNQIISQPYWAFFVLAYAIVFGLFLLLVKNKWVWWILPVVSILLFSISFPLNKFLFYGIVLGSIVIVGGLDEARKELAGSLKLFIKKVLSRPTRFFFTSLALVVAFSYYGGIKDSPNKISLILPKQVFEVTLKLLEVPIRGFIPNFKPDAKVADILPPAERAGYEKSLGVTLHGNDKISDVLYNFSLSRIDEYAGSFVDYSPIIAAASYFFALKFVSIIFYYLATLLIFGIIKILLATGLVEKMSTPAEKEILV